MNTNIFWRMALLPFLFAISTPDASAQTKLWERWEKAFTAPAGTSPEIECSGELTSPSGKIHSVRGFWDGDNVWKIRFMPNETGQWNYRIQTDPPIPGLHNQQGDFSCQPNDSSTRFLKHGRIDVSPDGFHFQHADGTPFFWLADTVWNGALLSSESDWERFLEDRRGKKFTGIQFVATQWRTAYADAEGMVAYTGFENIQVNPAFFQRIEKRLEAVNRHGLLAVPVLLWTLGSEKHNPGRLPEDQAIRLARYMDARFHADHVAYFLPGDGNYSGANAERWKRIGGAVFPQPGHPPVTLHPQGMQWPFDAFLPERWVTFFGYQSGHGDDAHALRWIHSGPPSEKWKLEPRRPVINLEPPYEDHVAYQSRQRHTDFTVRRATYWSMLNAPAAGVSYGAHGVWSWETTAREPQEHGGTGIAQPWHAAMNLPGSEQMKHLAELFTSVDWWRLHPDRELVRQQARQFVQTELTHLVYTRGQDGIAKLYLNGKPVAESQIPGDLSNWDGQFRLGLASELSGERPWRGEYHRVSLFSRDLSSAEVEKLFQSGLDQRPEDAAACYDFVEGKGEMVRDVSGSGEALDLKIDNTDAVQWLPKRGLAVTSPVLIASSGPASKLIDAAKASQALTLEAWIKPANLTQAGPSRIFTISKDTGVRNVTLAQDISGYQIRLRTTRTSPNGEPSLNTPGGLDFTFVGSSRSERGDLAVLYFPTGQSAEVHTGRLQTGLLAEWFNPRTGEKQEATPIGQRMFRTPDENDWVLMFRRKNSD
jgi:hypothetical protein